MTPLLTPNKKEVTTRIHNIFKNKYGFTNIMLIPTLIKIILNLRLGSIAQNKKILSNIINDITSITLQTPTIILSSKSISNFNLKQNTPNSLKVTLRGNNMYNFLGKLINISIPRLNNKLIINKKSIDNQSNITLGIHDHSIFYEIFNRVSLSNPIGLDITLNIRTINQLNSYYLLKTLGFTFK